LISKRFLGISSFTWTIESDTFQSGRADNNGVPKKQFREIEWPIAHQQAIFYVQFVSVEMPFFSGIWRVKRPTRARPSPSGTRIDHRFEA
jgi:hypothetical protein